MRQPRRLLGLVAAIAVLVGGAVVAVTGGGEDPVAPAAVAKRWTAPDRSFSVALPPSWTAAASGLGGTVLSRADDAGLVVVRRHPGVKGTLTALSPALVRSVRKALPGARSAGTRRFKAGGRAALLTTFVRGSRVHAVAVVPAGADRSFSLDAVATGGQASVARDIGALLRSFRPAQG